jgi:polar amino acid transport system substrate-binding protein
MTSRGDIPNGAIAADHIMAATPGIRRWATVPSHYPRGIERRRFAKLSAAGFALVWLTCLGCDVPRDPEGTCARVRGGTMRVGITEHAPWTSFEHDEPSGIEVQLLRKFARQLGAEIEWQRGSESQLMGALQGGALDMVIGGVKESTPWSSYVGMTRPYVTLNSEAYVMVVRQGENCWLLALDKFLHGHKAEINRLLESHIRP